MKWPEQFFKRHGPTDVLIARFIPLFPPVAANLLAGMGKMSWRIFLFYNITGSAAYTVTYILIGYFFGKKRKLLEVWLGPTALYLSLAGIVIVVLGVIFRHSLRSSVGRAPEWHSGGQGFEPSEFCFILRSEPTIGDFERRMVSSIALGDGGLFAVSSELRMAGHLEQISNDVLHLYH